MEATEFSNLYREHLVAITKFIARRVDTAQVEDLAADLFEIAWRKRSEIPTGYELPWLYKTARYLISNFRRKQSGRAQAMLSFGEPNSAPSAESIAIADLSLASAWKSLTLQQQEVLALFAWEGLAPDQLAKALGVTTNAASVRLSRARAALASALDKEESTVF